MPWLLAAFLAMLFFVPIDSTELHIHLPVDSRIDRFAVALLVLAWACLGGDQHAFLRTKRSKLFVGAASVFLAVAIASLVLDVGRIVNVGELSLAAKRFMLLGSFLAVSWFALTALRFADLRGFSSYLIGLGTLTGLGVLVERHTGFNVFYAWSSAVLKPIATVSAAPTNIHPEYGSDGRVVVVGPTIHGLAVTTMLMLVMPFALVRALDATSRRARWMNAAAVVVMLAGAASTDRKSALLVPVAIALYFAWKRPHQLARWPSLAAAVVLVGMIHMTSPGALGSLLSPSSGFESSSTLHRLGDFEDVAPDVLAHPVLGRGFGTLDPEQPTVFRINDDEYIDEIWEVGAIGLVAYVFMVLAPVFAARGAIRDRDPEVEPLALAASAGCVAYFVLNALFDAMSFPQAPYMFFVVASLATIAAAGPAGDVRDDDARSARALSHQGFVRRSSVVWRPPAPTRARATATISPER